MKQFWEQISNKLKSLNTREKVLFFIMGLVFIPGMMDYFLLQPLRDSSTLLQKQTQVINQRLQSFTQQQDDLLKEIQSDPAMDLERRIEGVIKALAATKEALISYTDTLIAPRRMATMIENILHARGSLQLVSLENLPVRPLFRRQEGQQGSTAQRTQDAEKSTSVFGLYRHGIQLVFKGNYMTTMAYLQQLEQLPWKFYWQHFNYEVQNYPEALITLNIYTLSTSQWWIGDDNES